MAANLEVPEQDVDDDNANTRYHHDFSEEELDMMLFQWDEAAEPVREYHYMKPEWQTPDAVVSGATAKQKKKTSSVPPKRDMPDLRERARDAGDRSIVDLNRDAPPDEEPVPLNLDTGSAVHVVDFYQPWCGHCRSSKPHYIDVAREVARRSIGIPVKFHAVSCQLYREICRHYSISGFPFVMGWGINMDIEDVGIELNPPGVTVSAEVIAGAMGLTLASEAQDRKKGEALSPEETRTLISKAIEIRRQRLNVPSTINDRYHDAAVSLAFVLKTAVFTQQSNVLDYQRASELQEFLELVHWATPHTWSVRTGMVQEVLEKFKEISQGGAGPGMLTSLIQNHQAMEATQEGELWGHIKIKHPRGDTIGLGGDAPHRRMPPAGTAEEHYRKNNKWTSACTKEDRGMGFTCGLWQLFHIISIGSSLEEQRRYGSQLGYSVAPKQIAMILKRFVTNFFPCDVCRWNFQDMYDQCGYNHCIRLVDKLPDVSSPNAEQADRELSIWLWEVHNGVSVRLMREAAHRESRKVNRAEQLAAVFPNLTVCPLCWLPDTNMTKYDTDEVYKFLKAWYWPSERLSTKIQQRLSRSRVASALPLWFTLLFPVALVLGLVFRLKHGGRRLKVPARKNV
jgi:thiol-disulfide isomerase/thioredoxin